MGKSDYTASTLNSDTSQHEVNPPPSDVGVITNTRYERNKEAQPLQKFPEDISKGEIHIPVQPKLNTYPWKYFGAAKQVKRRFQSSFLRNFHGWNILFSRMLHIAFAVVIGAKKVHRLLNLQDFLTGSMQHVKSTD